MFGYSSMMHFYFYYSENNNNSTQQTLFPNSRDVWQDLAATYRLANWRNWVLESEVSSKVKPTAQVLTRWGPDPNPLLILGHSRLTRFTEYSFTKYTDS